MCYILCSKCTASADSDGLNVAVTVIKIVFTIVRAAVFDIVAEAILVCETLRYEKKCMADGEAGLDLPV